MKQLHSIVRLAGTSSVILKRQDGKFVASNRSGVTASVPSATRFVHPVDARDYARTHGFNVINQTASRISVPGNTPEAIMSF